jgi:hypothetical protein
MNLVVDDVSLVTQLALAPHPPSSYRAIPTPLGGGGRGCGLPALLSHHVLPAWDGAVTQPQHLTQPLTLTHPGHHA